MLSSRNVYSSDNQTAQTGAKQYLSFILVNISSLKEKDQLTAKSLSQWKGRFTPNQLSLIDSLYENVMTGLGYGGFKATYKPKRRF